MSDMNSRNVKEKVLSTRNTKRFKTNIIKWNTNKISKLINDSTVSKFATRNWIEKK